MRSAAPEIFLGDLVLANRSIGLSDPGIVEAIARLLGFHIGEPAHLTDVDPAEPEEPASYVPPKEEPEERAEGPHDAEPETTDREPKVVDFDFRHEMFAIPPEPTRDDLWPDWDRDAPKPSLVPLLRPEWTRAIIGELMATVREDGPVNISKVVDAMARCEGLERLPRNKASTLSQGCQVLADSGEGMMPFRADTRDLIKLIRTTVGIDQVEVLYFEDFPLHGVEKDPDLDFLRYEPPRKGTPVTIITDLGIADLPFSLRRSSTAEWLKLAGILESQGCPFVALVPYPDTRWPPELGNQFPIIQWDRGLNIFAARRVLDRS